MEAKPGLERVMSGQMVSSRIYLDAPKRVCVENTIREVTAHRNWKLHALNVRTNHVHLVVSANCKPEKVMNDCKSWTTRRLREQGHLLAVEKAWAEHGSTVYLDGVNSFENACGYVVEGQGEDLPA